MGNSHETLAAEQQQAKIVLFSQFATVSFGLLNK